MMDRINSLLKKYLKLNDSGKIFRNPVKTIYIIIGWLHLLVPLWVLKIIYEIIDTESNILTPLLFSANINYHEHNNGGNTFAGIVTIILLLAVAALVAYLAIKLWNDRAQRVSILLNNQSEFCVLPIISAFFRNVGESQGILIAVSGTGVAIAFGIGMLLASFFNLDSFLGCIKVMLIALIAGPILSIIIGYLTLLIGRFFSESIRLMISIADNVSHLANKSN